MLPVGDGGVRPSSGRHLGDAGGLADRTRSNGRARGRSTATTGDTLAKRRLRGTTADAAADLAVRRVSGETVPQLRVRICAPWQQASAEGTVHFFRWVARQQRDSGAAMTKQIHAQNVNKHPAEGGSSLPTKLRGGPARGRGTIQNFASYKFWN